MSICLHVFRCSSENHSKWWLNGGRCPLGSHGRSGATTGAWAMKLFPGCSYEVRNVPALFYESCPCYDILKTKKPII